MVIDPLRFQARGGQEPQTLRRLGRRQPQAEAAALAQGRGPGHDLDSQSTRLQGGLAFYGRRRTAEGEDRFPRFGAGVVGGAGHQGCGQRVMTFPAWARVAAMANIFVAEPTFNFPDSW